MARTFRRSALTLAFALPLATLFATSMSGCATTGPRVAGEPDASTKAAFEQLKTLAGTWESVDEKGQKQVASVVTVTSAGSVVREVMFPGAAHEMTNMYHLDGSSIIATHYCAMGNQPRMRCTKSDGKTFHFTFDDISNLPSKDVDPMAGLVVDIKDRNTFVQTWDTLRQNGEHHMVFELTRKQ
jgi:hypothetical protein